MAKREDAAFMAMIANIPAGPPPPGVVSNFDNPKTYGSGVVIVALIFTAIAVTSVALRFYVRKFLSRQKLWWDDGQ
jgi:hypothetical protein